MSNQVWLFMAATAMATTVSTLAATAMVKADAADTVGAEAVAVTCACEAAPAASVAPVVPSPPIAAAPEAVEQEQGQEQEQRVTTPKAKVEGALDKSIIRRIVKAHINEVRYCYNQGLTGDPELAGRVEVAFTIGTDGRVAKSEISSTTMEESDVPQCIAQAVQRWMFPKPANNEKVQVTYPFVLEPG